MHQDGYTRRIVFKGAYDYCRTIGNLVVPDTFGLNVYKLPQLILGIYVHKESCALLGQSSSNAGGCGSQQSIMSSW